MKDAENKDYSRDLVLRVSPSRNAFVVEEHKPGGILTMRKEVKKIPGIRYSKYTWNPAYKGVDDYLLSRVAAM